MKLAYLLLLLTLATLAFGCTTDTVNEPAPVDPDPEPEEETEVEVVEEEEAEVVDEAETQTVELPIDITQTTSYTLDTAASTLGYSATRLAANPHTGTVDITEGSLLVENSVATGSFTIDMDTITDNRDSQMYLAHVKGDDFFAVDQFPTSALEITSIAQDGEGFVIVGDLTIRDQTHEISFPATATFSDERVEAHAEFEIDRTRWGIVFDSGSIFTNLGDRAIKDEIEFTLDVVFVQE